MADGLQAFLRCLHRLARAPSGGTLTDGQLLDRFVAERDQAAFEVLVWRHGPMVLNVCRRLLGRPEDAEDAFQAAFLVLVRKARSVRRHDALGAWLYRVAYRVALRARAGIARRAGHERPGVDEAPAPAADGGAGPDLRPVLDEEISRLPEKYRTAVVLCYLEGKSNQEAAACLGCAEGTVASRLSRARERLRARLVRRGLAVSVAVVTTVLAEKAAPAAVGAALVETTAKAALQFAAGGPAALGAVSARAAALAKGALRAMWVTKLKTVAAVVLVAALLGAGLGGLLYNKLSAAPPPAGRDQPGYTPTEPPAPDQDLLTVPSQRDGVLLFVGTEIKEGEKVPPEQVLEVTETYAYVEIRPGEKVPPDEQVKLEVRDGESKQTKLFRRMNDTDKPEAEQVVIASRKRRLRTLQEGDAIQEGQLLAMVDPRLAVADFLSKKTRVETSVADWKTSIKTRDEAEQRYRTMIRLRSGVIKNAVSEEEVRAAKLTWDRYYFEEISKREAIKQARSELSQALTVLKMHEVRSPAGGVITRICKHRGEALKYLEPVVQIRPAEAGAPGAAGARDKDLLDVPGPRDGILLVVGTDIKKGEKVAPEQVITVKIDGEEQKYCRLRVGDTVEEGQLLARLDDRLARDDLAAKEEKVKAAEADWQAALKTRDEAEQRYRTMQRLLDGKVKGVISLEDLRGAKLTFDRYSSEEVAKKAAVALAKVDVKSAQTVVEMYQVRSPARGVITRIYKRRGEAVKYLEPVVQIRVKDSQDE